MLPAVFAVADVVIGKPIVALFTAFGSFATLRRLDDAFRDYLAERAQNISRSLTS